MKRYNGLNVDHRTVAENAAWRAWRTGHAIAPAVQHALARFGIVATEAAFADAGAHVDRMRSRPRHLMALNGRAS